MLQEYDNYNFMSKNFIDEVINGMYDWVRVIDRDSNVIYMNKAMCEGLGTCQTGQKCYIATGKKAPCENCISRRAIFDGRVHEKEEIIHSRIYSVMSSPVKNENGEIIAAVEVLRDVTQVRQLQQKINQQNAILQKDLDAAKNLQRSLLPKGFKDDRVDFRYFYRPCEALGGDFLDIFSIDSDHIGMYIADVSGHGVSSSMLTVFLHSTLDRSLLSPAQALSQLYEKFNKSGIFEDLYITVFYAVIDLKNYTITYSNAGHNVIPVVFDHKTFDLLNSAGIPISNWLPEPCYSDTTRALKKGENIFFYTDGVVEIRNEANKQFGEDRLAEILTEAPGTPEEILQNITSKIDDFMGKEGIEASHDDITIAILQIK